MNSSDEKIIPLSKTKMLLLVFGAGLFVALGIWMLSLDQVTIESQRRFNSPVALYSIAVTAIVFFGAIGLWGLIRLFNKKPGLVVNSIGIVDNASGIAAGFIPWTEILGAEIYVIQKQKMLVIKVRNPEDYIKRGGRLRQAINKVNHKMCGSPIAITSNALKINFAELLTMFSHYHQKYGTLA